MNTPTVSRRGFLKRSGFLTISFAMLPAVPAIAQEANRRREGEANLDSRIRLNADGTVMIFTGKIELGQGMRTAMAQIAAEELDIAVNRVRVTMADTGATPNEGSTVASMSIQQSGMALRSAAAEAKQILLEMAAETLKVPLDRLTVRDGTITARDAQSSTTYWQLLGGKRINRRATGAVTIKKPEQHTVVGQSVPRLEIPDIVTGRAIFVQDLKLPGMLHARVLRPPTYGATLKSLATDEVTTMPGVVKIVRDGSFAAVITEREEQAIWALQRLRGLAEWSDGQDMPAFKDLRQHLRTNAAEPQMVRNVGNVDEAWNAAKHRVETTYSRPYHMHASIGPSCSVAHLQGNELTVWSHTQGVFALRQTLANLLGMPTEKVRVIGAFAAGCYGHNGADDAAGDAALLAKAMPGRPIRVQWMREDEHAWEPYAPAMIFGVRGGVDEAGNIVAWDYTIYSDSHGARPGGDAAALLPAWSLAQPRRNGRGRGVGGGTRNADPLYALPNQRIAARYCPGPLRTSAMRGLGAYANLFAIESFMDELAHKAGVDPVAFRLRHLRNDRARAVIEAAAKAFGWDRKLPEGRGRGIGFSQYKNSASYLAVCAEVDVQMPDAEIRLKRLVAAVDAGQVINPDGLRNQIEGGMIQSASQTLLEQVTFDRRRVTSRDWNTYPILRFDQAPLTEVVVLDRPELPPLGAGEAAAGPTAAAIANAVFNATGRRVRDLPLTSDRIRSTQEQA